MMGIAATLDTRQVDSLASGFTLVGWFGTGAINWFSTYAADRDTDV